MTSVVTGSASIAAECFFQHGRMFVTRPGNLDAMWQTTVKTDLYDLFGEYDPNRRSESDHEAAPPHDAVPRSEQHPEEPADVSETICSSRISGGGR